MKRSKAKLMPRLRMMIVLLALGLATTIAVAMLMTLVVDVQQGAQRVADSFDGDEHWTVTRWDRAGAAQISSSRVRGAGTAAWAPQQAAGPPNTPQQGDQGTAWASQSTTSPEWLVLDYSKAVIPREVHVYESYMPGALTKVTIFDEKGQEIEAWSGFDPNRPKTATPPGSTTPPVRSTGARLDVFDSSDLDSGAIALGPSSGSPGPTSPPSAATLVSKIKISLTVPTKRIKLYISSDQVPGWNEIDAVGLVGDKGNLQWAMHVSASSTYASTSYPQSGQGNPWELTPPWSGLDKPTQSFADGDLYAEDCRADARGWPLLALRSETNDQGAAKSSPAQPPVLQLKSLGGLPAANSPGGTGIGSYTVYGSGTVAITTPTNAAPVPVPLRPIWFGLIGDTIFYAVIWLGLWMTLVIPRRFFREVARFRRGGCVQCGYDLGYDFINGCPECGWRRDQQTAPAPTRRTSVPEPINGR